MERVNKALTPREMEALNRAMNVYRSKLEEKMTELDQVQTHLKVNEGLMQEVRLEKERIRKELSYCNSILHKMIEFGGEGQ